MKPRVCLLVALLLGALLPLAFAPFGIFPLAILLPAGLIWLLDSANSRRHGFFIGFVFGFAGFLGGLYWLYISLHTFGNAPLIIAIPLMLATVAIMATYTGLFGWIYVRWLGRFPLFTRYVLLAPSVWVLLDWTRGWLATGFPWLSLGYSQTDSVMLGYAPVLGVFGITYLLLVLAGAVVYLVRRPRSPWVLALIVLVMVVAALLRPLSYTQPVGEPVQVSLVQGSVPQDQKWKQEQFVPTLELYRDLTLAHLDSDLVVWPEAAIPAFASRVSDFLSLMRQDLSATDTDLVLGIPRHSDGLFYNSVLAISGNQTSTYDKRHLVPFGEYFPVPQFVRRWMRLRNLPYSDYQAGAKDQAPLILADQVVAVTICYEDVFGEEQLEAASRVTLLLNVSNDAWFGDSIAPHQHLQISRMRAAEVRRYLLRTTNTGISAVISATGTVLQTLPQFETDVITAKVSGRAGLTPYARWGNWFIVSFAMLMILISLGLGRPGTEA